MKIVLTLVFAALLAGCSTFDTHVDLDEWGPARDELKKSTTAEVAPIALPERVDGDMTPEDRKAVETEWPQLGADEFGKGLVAGDGYLELQKGGDLVVRNTFDVIDVGDGGKRYWGSGGSSLITGRCEVFTKSGELVVRLRLRQTNLREPGLAYKKDCFLLGEKVGEWLEENQR